MPGPRRGPRQTGPGRRPRSESSDIVKSMKHSKVQSPSPLKEKHGPVSFEHLQSERLSFNSTFRHRHVSPTRKSRNTLTDNTGVGEAKAAEYMAEVSSKADDNIGYSVDTDAKRKQDRERATLGIFEGDITQKKSQFESNIDPKAKLLKASISRALAQTLRAQIGALPEVKPWSLLTAAMKAEGDSKGSSTGFSNRAGPKKMTENMRE